MLLMPKRDTAILVQDNKDILEKNPKTASCSKKTELDIKMTANAD